MTLFCPYFSLLCPCLSHFYHWLSLFWPETVPVWTLLSCFQSLKPGGKIMVSLLPGLREYSLVNKTAQLLLALFTTAALPNILEKVGSCFEYILLACKSNKLTRCQILILNNLGQPTVHCTAPQLHCIILYISGEYPSLPAARMTAG